MNDLEDSTMPLSRNPEQPSRQSRCSLPYRKRQLVRPSEPPVSIGFTHRHEQPLAHLNHSSIQRDEVYNRFSDIATIKSEALRPPASFDTKKKAISYPAVVNARRPGKSSLFARVACFFLK